MNRRLIFGLLFVLGTGTLAYAGSIPPRDVAKRAAEDSIEQVRRYMFTNPSVMEAYLIDMLAAPIGDDPRVLDLCREIVEKSASPANGRVVVQAILIIADRHLNTLSRATQQARIAGIARHLMTIEDADTEDGAAAVLMLLGGRYADEAADYYVKLLRSTAPHGRTEAEQRDLVYRNAIFSLIRRGRSETYPLIREVTSKYGLLDSYRAWIAQDPKRRVGGNFVAEWASVMGTAK